MKFSKKKKKFYIYYIFLLIVKSKIRREKHIIRYSLQSDSRNVELHGLYFDGRKDNIYYQEKDANKLYRRLKKEEHISSVQEPGGKYLGAFDSFKSF